MYAKLKYKTKLRNETSKRKVQLHAENSFGKSKENS